ncbi:MAG: hypothetical protein HYZ29_14690 [Myxococcales bacterium]|nr:hypothetical protein [Myxococcales bacterium]
MPTTRRFRALGVLVTATLAWSGGGCNSDAGPSAGGGGGAGGGGAGGGGADAGPTCQPGGLRFIMALDPDPTAAGSPKIIDLEGYITAKASKGFTLDSCHPSAACSPSLTTVSYDVHGKQSPPDIDWPVGAYVTVRYAFAFTGSESTLATLSVRNLPSWEGSTNPVSTSERWYLLATHGYLKHPQAPFEVAEGKVDGCPHNYQLLVRPPGGAWTTLVQGQSGSVVVNGWRYDISVVSSNRALWSDADPPFSWWATSVPAD